jgi:hypothetical protein
LPLVITDGEAAVTAAASSADKPAPSIVETRRDLNEQAGRKAARRRHANREFRASPEADEITAQAGANAKRSQPPNGAIRAGSQERQPRGIWGEASIAASAREALSQKDISSSLDMAASIARGLRLAMVLS